MTCTSALVIQDGPFQNVVSRPTTAICFFYTHNLQVLFTALKIILACSAVAFFLYYVFVRTICVLYRYWWYLKICSICFAALFSLMKS